MVSKVSDWVFGSFFRTVGRLLVFIILGFIIAHFVDFGSIRDNFSISDLLFDKVDALTITENVKSSGSGYFSVNNPNDFLQYNDLYYTTVTSGWIDRAIYFYFNPRPNTEKHDYIEFPFIASMPSQTEINYPVQDDFVTCRTWTCESYNNSGNCSQYKCLNWYTSGTSTVNDHLITDYEVNSLSFYAMIEFNDANGNWAGWHSCSIQGNSFICPLEHDLSIKYIKVIINYNPPKSSQFYFGIMRGYNLYKGQDIQNAVEQNTQAINQQTQQQQQQHQQIMDTNTTQAESQASDFFSDFSVTDHGGLASILTAPLTIFNSILNDSCVPATFTYRNKQVSLPCGQTFWNQAPNVRDWLSTIESGIIAYCILISLFKLIQKLESPSNSEVEVESL